jgi:hypothetical protein
MDDRYLKLRMLSEMYWDCQEFRKAMASKARSGTVDDVVALALAKYREVETAMSRTMVRELRAAAPPEIRDWIADSPGVGEHLAAKLLGVIGDPYMAHPQHWEDRPGAAGGKGDPKRVLVADPPYVRNVDKLWAYCGVGDPARRRTAGMTQDEAAALGHWKAKTTLRLIAEACLKQPGTTYELVYRKARAEYDGRVHATPCAQCKGSGAVGQPWKAGHQHAAALRKVAKEVLRDLWEAARAAHQADQAAA